MRCMALRRVLRWLLLSVRLLYLRLLLMHSRLLKSWWQRRRLLLRLLRLLVALRIEARIHRGFSICEPLVAALQRCMLSLLPRWDVRWGRYVHARHGIRIRRHVRLCALA